MKIIGMILAAGFGTRLLPLTETSPKALVPFMGKPMIDYVIMKMKNFGIEKIVVNVHHQREKLISYLTETNFGVEIIISDEKKEHLLTGGGIKNASRYFSDSELVLVHNTDIISSIDYKKFVNFHLEKKAAVTLAVREKNDTRVFCFDNNMELTGWKNKSTGEKIVSKETVSATEYGFNGVYLLSKNSILNFPDAQKFSIVDFFLDYTKKVKVIGFVDESPYWFDLGSVDKINTAEEYFKFGRFKNE